MPTIMPDRMPRMYDVVLRARLEAVTGREVLNGPKAQFGSGLIGLGFRTVERPHQIRKGPVKVQVQKPVVGKGRRFATRRMAPGQEGSQWLSGHRQAWKPAL
jgi:hypothetical protein